MTAKEYQDKGYRVSLQVSQAEIDRAERDIIYAYIAAIYPIGDPLQPGYPQPEVVSQFIDAVKKDDWSEGFEVLYRCFAVLVVLLLAQRGILSTRGGGKLPTAAGATTPAGDDMLRQYSAEAAMYIERVKTVVLSDMETEEDKQMYSDMQATMSDICGIYWLTNYYKG